MSPADPSTKRSRPRRKDVTPTPPPEPDPLSHFDGDPWPVRMLAHIVATLPKIGWGRAALGVGATWIGLQKLIEWLGGR